MCSQLDKSMSHVTPDIERYYEYHKELYDFTFGAERETARSQLETGTAAIADCCCGSPGAVWQAGNKRTCLVPTKSLHMMLDLTLTALLRGALATQGHPRYQKQGNFLCAVH